jgi:competence protein ComEA
VLAARIVEHRRLHGAFRSVEELRSVPGIGPRLLARLRPSLREPPG